MVFVGPAEDAAVDTAAEERRKFDELVKRKYVEQCKHDQLEEQLARNRVRDQIDGDRLARQNKRNGLPPRAATSAAIAALQQSPSPPATVGHRVTRIQVRMPDAADSGTLLTETFGAKEPLSAVRLFVQLKQGLLDEPFTLMTAYPCRVFGADDYDRTLEMLGLVPSAVVIVKKERQLDDDGDYRM